jgi:hypothetical protein
MKYIKQSILDPENGDCFRACVCSILELDPATVPNFCSYSVDQWWGRFIDWAKSSGYALYWGTYPPMHVEYYIVSGKSPRYPNRLHSVVWHNYEMVHDPHPDGTGIKSITDYIWLEKVG